MSTVADVPSLTPNQINALVVLMVEARELTNSELRELAGFTLTGKDNRKLVDEGLVATDRSHRPFTHELTDRGWRVLRQLHTVPPPRAGGSATRSLFTVLRNTHRALDRLRVSPAEFFTQTSAPGPAAPVDADGAAAAGPAPVDLVRAAYQDLAGSPGSWVGLADLRDRLGGQDRAAVDEALRTLVHQPGVRIIPVANTKSLTARDRAAAVRIGDEDNHALSIGPA
ncbi:hypothetical protein [Micromonospora echinofusca]|uniref:MarR family transcriptional regulator n=1 Tax=Micromonospora echinofusca TaxID=47858 RepID=A0ABS3VTV9_MICEH|nr:hypothetical protein [Micromonospora echinofusca]MBO4207969.1 hypothetical protein [Micromonospora echinofusca]